MIFDNELMFFDGDAGGATASASVDFGLGGCNEQLDVHFSGVGMTAGTNLVLADSADDVTFTTKMDITVDFSVLNQGFSFRLPPDLRRYATLTVTAGAGGTMTAGVVKDAQLGY